MNFAVPGECCGKPPAALRLDQTIAAYRQLTTGLMKMLSAVAGNRDDIDLALGRDMSVSAARQLRMLGVEDVLLPEMASLEPFARTVLRNEHQGSGGVSV